MRKVALRFTFIAIAAFGFIIFGACNNNDHKEPVVQSEVSGDHVHNYQCPMKCEGEKTYGEPGSCPKCGMDLQEMS